MVQRRFPLVVGFLGSLSVGLLGCNGEGVEPPKPAENPTPLYWQLTSNQHAITLSTAAPHDTFRLVATPRMLDGTPLAGLAGPHFASDEPDVVQVSPDGLVRGLQEVPRVKIVVTLSDPTANLTHVDSAFVTVTTAMPPPLARLSLDPDPPDSAKSTLDGGIYWSQGGVAPRALDAQGNELASLAVWIESSDPLTALYNNEHKRLSLRRPGRVTLRASMAAYGVERADTLVYTAGLPLSRSVQLQLRHAFGGTASTYRFSPSTITVGVGAYIWWLRDAGAPIYDITFDNPMHVAADTAFEQLFGFSTSCGASAGSIAPFDFIPGFDIGLCSRYFPVPGPYRYRSATLDATGMIMVVDEGQAVAANVAIATWPPAAQRPAALLRGLRHVQAQRSQAGTGRLLMSP